MSTPRHGTAVVEGDVPLPAGKADIYAVIEDLGAVDALVDDLPSGVFEARQSALLADRRMIQQYGSSLEQLHAEGSLMAPGGAGMMALAGEEVAELSGSQYTLRTPRTSTWIQRLDDAGWQRLVMDEPAVEMAPNSRLMSCSMGVSYWYRVIREWDEETLVGLFRGDDVAYMMRLRDVTETADFDWLPPECEGSVPDPVVAAERVPAVVYDTTASQARREGFHPGRHHLAATTSAVDRTPRVGWVDVDAGTASFDNRSLGDTPFWANGTLLGFQLVDPSDGLADHVATLVRQSSGAQEWLVRVESSTGEGASVFSTAGVNAEPVVARWWPNALPATSAAPLTQRRLAAFTRVSRWSEWQAWVLPISLSNMGMRNEESDVVGSGVAGPGWRLGRGGSGVRTAGCGGCRCCGGGRAEGGTEPAGTAAPGR